MRILGVHQAAYMVGLMTATCGAPAEGAANRSRDVWVGESRNKAPGAGNSKFANKAQIVRRESRAVRAIRRQFAELRRLQDGWDGAGSKAPAAPVISHAASLLDRAFDGLLYVEAPRVVPVADGGLQAEWYSPSHRFEAYFDVDGEFSAWSENRETGVEMEEEGDAAKQLLLDWMTARESDHLFLA